MDLDTAGSLNAEKPRSAPLATTRARARGVPAFLLQPDGDFTADGVPIPYGARPPTGHQLMVVVDATLTVTDSGPSDALADIRTLGPVFQGPTTG